MSMDLENAIHTTMLEICKWDAEMQMRNVLDNFHLAIARRIMILIGTNGNDGLDTFSYNRPIKDKEW